MRRNNEYKAYHCESCEGVMSFDAVVANEGNCPFCQYYMADRDDELTMAVIDYFSEQEMTTEDESLFPIVAPEDNGIGSTFVVRLLTKVSLKELEAFFGGLDVSVEYVKNISTGLLKELMQTASGKRLLKSYKLDEKKLQDYKLEITLMDPSEEEKLRVVSTILKTFDLSVLREENSSYIIASNKGLAKNIASLETEMTVLTHFLTGYEKYDLLIQWIEFSKKASTQDYEIVLKWIGEEDLSFSELKDKDKIPMKWLNYLSEYDFMTISFDASDTDGVYYFYEDMLEELNLYEKNTKINICSARGCADYIDKGGTQ